MNNKARGSAKERKIKNHYEKAGWIVVRSGASQSPFDLICIKPETNEIHVVQLKWGTEKYLKYGTKREEAEFSVYKDGDYSVKFKFIKLEMFERFKIDV